jgi:DNA-binding NtrC family response regulator
MTVTESKRTQQQYRLLCVDDDELLVSINAIILRAKGYEVLACSDPLRACWIVQSEELHLAILDYEMPMMSGGELAAFCRAINPDIKVILFSGALEISSRDLAVTDVFIQKPSGIEVLLEAIETLLYQRKEIQGGHTSTIHKKAKAMES